MHAAFGMDRGIQKTLNHRKIKEKGGIVSFEVVLGTRNEPWQVRDSALPNEHTHAIKTADGGNVCILASIVHCPKLLITHCTVTVVCMYIPLEYSYVDSNNIIMLFFTRAANITKQR